MTAPHKLNIKLIYIPAVLVLGVYPKGLKVDTKTDICILTAPLFTAAKRWKQLRCPLIDEWRSKNVVYPYNGILFSLQKGGNSDTGCNMDGL